MFKRPTLSQSQQPKEYYEYDGLSGGWLWFPWWVHIGVALLAWPIFWWIVPLLPFQNVSISHFLLEYRVQLAASVSILTVLTAILSVLKAREISAARKIVQKKRRSSPKKSPSKKVESTVVKEKKRAEVKPVVEKKTRRKKAVKQNTMQQESLDF